MATLFEFVERIIKAIYLTPNPQVQTYFRDLRVTPAEPSADDDNDDDSHYRYVPEPNGDTGSSATVGTIRGAATQSKLSPRQSGGQPVAVAHVE